MTEEHKEIRFPFHTELIICSHSLYLGTRKKKRVCEARGGGGLRARRARKNKEVL